MHMLNIYMNSTNDTLLAFVSTFCTGLQRMEIGEIGSLGAPVLLPVEEASRRDHACAVIHPHLTEDVLVLGRIPSYPDVIFKLVQVGG